MCGQSEASHNAARAVAALLRFSTFQPSLFERCAYFDSIPRGGIGGVLSHMVDAEAARWQCLGITVMHGKLSAGPGNAGRILQHADIVVPHELRLNQWLRFNLAIYHRLSVDVQQPPYPNHGCHVVEQVTRKGGRL
ncbi:hypothetical protein M404DRAFT_36213 [Pisolithus tinctorius Marx 270]|uniref:Uncharacterized protein n=1 Tax=Pisolithus tinctorius Marx 270 TaxID=870435 RepID=A0A0C3J6I9_PISTI|nr:hypothetical protein M404DRAFT_36213 [Pisolithus tinctorius Marx 270]